MMGALASVLTIWVITGILVYLAVMRIVNNDYDIDADIMLITAGLGVLVNILLVIFPFRKQNLTLFLTLLSTSARDDAGFKLHKNFIVLQNGCNFEILRGWSWTFTWRNESFTWHPT